MRIAALTRRWWQAVGIKTRQCLHRSSDGDTKSASDSGSSKSGAYTTRLHVAFATMLLITLALAWYFYNSAKWYQHDMTKVNQASQILQDYQSISDRILLMRINMEERIIGVSARGFEQDQLEVAALRGTIIDLRAQMHAEMNLSATPTDNRKLQRLGDIEKIVEQIIKTDELVAVALLASQPDQARSESEQLRNSGALFLFDRLIETVLEEQRNEVKAALNKAVELATYITGVLPLFVVALIIFTLFFVWLFSRSLSRSVLALGQGAIAFGSGDLGYRIPNLKEKEFRHLGEAFNQMASELSNHRTQLHDTNVKLEAVVNERTRALQESNTRLEAIDDNRRKLLADISHEFRTPLTVIKGEAEIAMRGTNKSKMDYRETLNRILSQASQTTRLVDDLLFIARAEVGEPRLSLDQISVADVLESVCSSFATAAKEKRIEIKLSNNAGDVVTFADAGRLHQVFSILLDNSLAYSSEASVVEVDIKLFKQKIVVSISDRGIGLSAEESQHVFDRFYRGNRAVSCDDGSGLGLPVAKAIVEAHGGKITLTARPEGGTIAMVNLQSVERSESSL